MVSHEDIIELIKDKDGCFGRYHDTESRECMDLCPAQNDCEIVCDKNFSVPNDDEKIEFKKPGMSSKNRMRAESAPSDMHLLQAIASANGWNVRETNSEYVCQKGSLKICLNKKKIFAYIHNDELFNDEDFKLECVERISKIEARQRHIGKTRVIVKGSNDALEILKEKLENN